MVTRTSQRWYRHWESTKRKPRVVPFVLQSGKFSSANLLTWDCTAEQLVASLTSTVYTRLLKILERRKRYIRDVTPEDRNQLLQVAAFYVVSHSDYFMDRALRLLGRRRPLSKVITSFVRKLDDNYWFVYRQVCYQTHWLTFRSLETRDKSSRLLLESFMSQDIEEARNGVIKSAFETASNVDRWIKFRKTPYVLVAKKRDQKPSKLDSEVLAFFSY